MANLRRFLVAGVDGSKLVEFAEQVFDQAAHLIAFSILVGGAVGP